MTKFKTLKRMGEAFAFSTLALLGASTLQSAATDLQSLGAFPLTIPTYKYGIEQERFASILTEEVSRGLTLSELIDRHSDNPDIKANLLITALDLLDDHKIIAGRKITTFTRPGQEFPDYLVYEVNNYSQVVFDFVKGEVRIRAEEVSTELVVGHSTIQSSLWNAVTDAGYSNQVALGVTKAVESSLSLRSLDKGDEFDMIYERKLVAGVDMGEGRVKMVRLRHRDKEIIALHFARADQGINGFYTTDGESLARGYLLNPVKGSRISSAYNMRRRHPILGYVRPHYGTDYAARHGSPIISVADGVIVEIGRTGGNGNYVKVKHDDTYSTQYLHMSRHVKGMRKGQFVSQGQTIGYVGSTGLATGPHVCFRFWKNNQQVNHLRIDLPRANPLPASLLPEFHAERDVLLEKMGLITPTSVASQNLSATRVSPKA